MIINMPAPKGNKNGQKSWFQGTGEERCVVSANVPVSFRDRARAAFLPGETVSQFLVRAIELLIEKRSLEKH